MEAVKAEPGIVSSHLFNDERLNIIKFNATLLAREIIGVKINASFIRVVNPSIIIRE